MLCRLSSSEPGGFKECPRGMLHPLHFIKGLISQKPFRSPPFNHIYSYSLRSDTSSDTSRGLPGAMPHSLYYILLLYAKSHPVTLTGGPLGQDSPPLLHLRAYVSETIQIPTLKHIYSCSSDTSQGPHRGMPQSLHFIKGL